MVEQTLHSTIEASNSMDSTLLITGSTGTGKSHLAQRVHAISKRASGRFSKVNLATLSENLIESELFGHEKGAFTGADSRRMGRLEASSGGTVFLDEIGELSPRLQSKLLDVIQYKKITPVGSNREVDLDVRIIAATNRDLEAMVKAGEFRADLFHRINVFQVKMPDLKNTRERILPLAKKFLTEKARRCDKQIIGFERDVELAFLAHEWNGNVRELENAIEYAVAMERGRTIRMASLPFAFHGHQLVSPRLAEEASTTTSPPKEIPLGAVGLVELALNTDYHQCKDTFERLYLEHMLRHFRGQINRTSRSIGLNKVSLTEKIRKYGIDWKAFREESRRDTADGLVSA